MTRADRPTLLPAVLVGLVVLAGCSAGTSAPTTTTGATATSTPAAEAPCRVDHPAIDALGRSLDWPTYPADGGRNATTAYATAFERTYVAANTTTETLAVETVIDDAVAERTRDGWRVRLNATRWLHPVDTPEGMSVVPGRRPYAVTYLVVDGRARRLEHDRTTRPNASVLRRAPVVDCRPPSP